MESGDPLSKAELYGRIARLCRLPGRGAITGTYLKHQRLLMKSLLVVFACIFVYSTEIYPTAVRSTGLGFCSFSARIGGIISPQIDRLIDLGLVWGPGAIVACLSFAACIVS